MERVCGRLWAAGAAIVAVLLPVAVCAADPPVTWTLQAVDHRTVTVADLPATWLLVYFGYTYCPDLCPTALLEIGDVLRDLGGMAGRVQPVFVTIDPERDTPELLARYVANFAAPIIPLTGTPEQMGGPHGSSATITCATGTRASAATASTTPRPSSSSTPAGIWSPISRPS